MLYTKKPAVRLANWYYQAFYIDDQRCRSCDRRSDDDRTVGSLIGDGDMAWLAADDLAKSFISVISTDLGQSTAKQKPFTTQRFSNTSHPTFRRSLQVQTRVDPVLSWTITTC